MASAPSREKETQTATVDELAKLIHCSTKHVRNHMRDPDWPIPPLPGLGRLVRFSRQSIDRYLAGQ